MVKDREDDAKKQTEWETKMQNEALRQAYFEMQRRNIEDFRLQKAETEDLLMIKGPPMNARAYHRNLSKA